MVSTFVAFDAGVTIITITGVSWRLRLCCVEALGVSILGHEGNVRWMKMVTLSASDRPS